MLHRILQPGHLHIEDILWIMVPTIRVVIIMAPSARLTDSGIFFIIA